MVNNEGPGWEMQQQLEEQEYFLSSENMTFGHNNNCHCNAYPFPHRALSGRCSGDELCLRTFDNGTACEGCEYHHEYTESHPYGMTYAVEQLHECQAASKQCPVVQEASRARP